MEGAANQSSFNPLALAFLITMVILTLKAPRRFAPIGLLITTSYMPLAQEFVVAGLHFQFLRVLLLVGIIRVASHQERADFVMTPLDKLFIYWGICGLVLGTLAEPTWERFVNRGGDAFNAFTTYFLFRCWIRNLEDVIQTTRILAFMVMPLAVSMIIEKFTTHNIFFVFGGVPDVTVVREGKLRCQGAFRHPILAGTYAATLFPLMVGLWFQMRPKRWVPALGALSTLVMAGAASSSGALLASATGFIGIVLWSARTKMSAVRWSIVAGLALLAMVMKAPIWYLPAKISDLMGGTGWHRSYLIDQAIIHFNEWWMIGSTVTAHGAPGGTTILGVDSKNMDITNNYIAEGLGGGCSSWACSSQ